MSVSYKKVKTYDGKTCYDIVDVYIKLDGVRAIRREDGTVVSRDNKPLNNLDHLVFKDAEIFLGDWGRSVSAVRTESYVEIGQEDVYELSDGGVDSRLYLCTLHRPSPDQLSSLMDEQVSLGNEGIVIRTGDSWLRVVPEKMADVMCTGMLPGSGKNVGKLGALLTEHGKVGTGFTDAQRVEFYNDPPVGQLIQVKYRELSSSGKLRFPAFKRVRLDKSEESFD